MNFPKMNDRTMIAQRASFDFALNYLKTLSSDADTSEVIHGLLTAIGDMNATGTINKTSTVDAIHREFASIVNEYNLTIGEQISIIGQALQIEAKYIIRAERHPENPEKPADLD